MAVTTKKSLSLDFLRGRSNSLQCNLQGWYLAQAISFISSLRTCHLSLSCDCAVLMKRILPANLDELQAHPSIPLKALAAPVWVELVTTDCLRTTCPKMRGNPLFQELKPSNMWAARVNSPCQQCIQVLVNRRFGWSWLTSLAHLVFSAQGRSFWNSYSYSIYCMCVWAHAVTEWFYLVLSAVEQWR